MPAPTVTVPADIIGYRPSTGKVYNLAGWPVVANNFNKTVEIQTVVKRVDVPRGMPIA